MYWFLPSKVISFLNYFIIFIEFVVGYLLFVNITNYNFCCHNQAERKASANDNSCFQPSSLLAKVVSA